MYHAVRAVFIVSIFLGQRCFLALFFQATDSVDLAEGPLVVAVDFVPTVAKCEPIHLIILTVSDTNLEFNRSLKFSGKSRSAIFVKSSLHIPTITFSDTMLPWSLARTHIDCGIVSFHTANAWLPKMPSASIGTVSGFPNYGNQDSKKRCHIDSKNDVSRSSFRRCFFQKTVLTLRVFGCLSVGLCRSAMDGMSYSGTLSQIWSQIQVTVPVHNSDWRQACDCWMERVLCWVDVARRLKRPFIALCADTAPRLQRFIAETRSDDSNATQPHLKTTTTHPQTEWSASP